MNTHPPRLRMFAGPNGSGKSTLKDVIPENLLGVYINPDEIEKTIADTGAINFSEFQITTATDEILPFLSASELLQKHGLADAVTSLTFSDNKLAFNSVEVNSYFASVIARFIREKLIEAGTSFTFETVMSHESKIAILKTAQAKGYRTYLYYVATEDPEINIARVQNRVFAGGHDVPEDKISDRYFRSLNLLPEAVKHTNRSYLFDNSGRERVWLSEIGTSAEGSHVTLKTDTLPRWFMTWFFDHLEE